MSAPNKQPTEKELCPVCGKEMTSPRRWQGTCSLRCINRKNYLLRRAALQEGLQATGEKK